MKSYVSLWSADLLDLRSAITMVDDLADGYHFDVFDGHYVPALLFGPDVVAAVRQVTDKPLDIHLNVNDCDAWIDPFADAGCDSICVPVSGCLNPAATLARIRARGVTATLVVEIDDPLDDIAGHLPAAERLLVMATAIGIKGVRPDESVYDRISTLREMADAQVEIIVDGAVRADTVPRYLQAGADGIVPGSLVFAASAPAEVLRGLRKLGPAAADRISR